MITLVLGGARSGKSAMAERIAASYGRPVTFVATAAVDRTDADHVARIAAHRARRPDGWTTVECSEGAELAGRLRSIAGVALVD